MFNALNLMQRKYREESGDDGDSDGDAGDTIDIKELAATVKGLAGAVGGIHNNIKTLTDSLAQQRNAKAEDDEEEEDGDDEDEDEDVNLETMSRTAFANHLVSKMAKHTAKLLKEQIKGISKDLNGVKAETAKDKMALDLKDAMDKHKDFEEWVPEVRSLMSETPGLSIKRAIALAKAEDPDKVAKMKEKYEKKDSGKDGKPESKGKGKFGGLPPNSSKTERDSRKTIKDASASAWEKALEKLEDPSVLNGEVV